jgi:hypothetical protein
MAGLRNVIRCAFKANINHLTIPLLMVHSLTAEMDAKWCMRRAELVLKCLKGFVMEGTAQSGGAESESRNILFLVPPETSHELFDGYSQLFAQIFRLAGAMVLGR